MKLRDERAREGMKIRSFFRSLGAIAIITIATLAALEIILHLEAKHIPFVTFDGAGAYPGAAVSGHWTPDGHKFVSERLFGLLSANHLIGNRPRASDAGGLQP